MAQSSPAVLGISHMKVFKIQMLSIRINRKIDRAGNEFSWPVYFYEMKQK